MLRVCLVSICSFGFGIALMDTLQQKKVCPALQTYAEPLNLLRPVRCDATMNGKCYIRGMR